MVNSHATDPARGSDAYVPSLAAIVGGQIPKTNQHPRSMKITSLTKQCAILAVSIGLALHGASGAEIVVRETTTRGVVNSFEPDTFIIKSDSGPAPMTYAYGKTIQYVDESGRVVTRESIKPGAPVTVHYVREGDRMVANRIIVGQTTTTTTEPGRPPTKKEAKELKEAAEHPEREARRAAEKGKLFPPRNPAEEKKTTTTTTTNADGTISSFTETEFALRGAGEKTVNYRHSKTTQYVDESGAPVSMEIVRSGAPVSVTYIREGDGFIAQRVIVHKRR